MGLSSRLKVKWFHWLSLFVLALAGVWWLNRPTTDPRLVGKWLQPAGAVFELRADGTGTFHYPTVTLKHPMFWSARGDEVRIETLSGIPHRDVMRRIGQLFGQRPARRFKLVEVTENSAVLYDGKPLSLTRVN